jgi:acetyl-CoA synthetase
VAITSPTLFRRTLAPILDDLPDLELVLICGASEDQSARSTMRPGAGPSVMSCGAFMCDGVDTFDVVTTDPGSPAIVHFTGDPDDTPGFVVHPHAPHHGGVRLDLRAGETFWSTTDPVWVTGVADDVTAALRAGGTSIVDEADFDPMRSLHILTHRHVDVLHTSAAVLRTLHAAARDRAPLAHPLRVVTTDGEQIEPAVARWAGTFLGTAVQEIHRSPNTADDTRSTRR